MTNSKANNQYLLDAGEAKLKEYITNYKAEQPIPVSVLSAAPHVQSIIQESESFYVSIAPELVQKTKIPASGRVGSAKENLSIAADFGARADALLEEKFRLLAIMTEQSVKIEQLKMKMVAQRTN